MNALGTHTKPIASTRQAVVDFAAQPVGDKPLVETFRLLALQVRNALRDMRQRSILVMSARQGDGRSMVASNLAHALAPLGGPVLIIDADVVGAGLPRNGATPSWHDESAFHAGVHQGNGNAYLPLVTHYRVDTTQRPQLDIVNEVHRVLEEAQELRTVAIVDTPSCLSSSLAFSLAGMAGAVLYVARRQVEDLSVHGEIRAQLDRLGATVLGVVFNEI